MNIAVLVKIVDGEVNIFDKAALEEALSIEGAFVTVISMSPMSAKEPLLSLTRLGVGRVIMLSDKSFSGADTYATAYTLSKALEKIEYDVIFSGRQTTDGDTAQVGVCLAALLNIEYATNVLSADIGKNSCALKTRFGDEKCSLPALLTFERTKNLRFPSIRSKLGEIEIWDCEALGADREKCGLCGSKTKVIEVFEKESGKRKCRFIKREELEGVIKQSMSVESVCCDDSSENQNKLACCIAIGKDAACEASKVFDNVELIESQNKDEICDIIRESGIKYVLWDASLWARRTAPYAAAKLGAGLCADVVKLETDGKDLYMYRPAKCQSVIAKIVCTSPVCMATVRTKTESEDIVLSLGRGMAERIDSAKEFAKKIGASLCASRGLVDSGLMPYEAQVGLTGKTVSPKIYIAAGISGAVHHIVGMEKSKTVIAINTDKDAKIFDYADYGIIGKL